MSCSGLKYYVAKNSNVNYFHQVAHEKHSKNQPLLEWTKDLVNHFWYRADICNTQEEYIVSKMKLNYEFRKKNPIIWIHDVIQVWFGKQKKNTRATNKMVVKINKDKQQSTRT